MLRITAGGMTFRAMFELEQAPLSCAAFRRLLPLQGKLLQARWSGEALWLPLGSLELHLGAENATSTPLAGQLLLYPAGMSETEVLFPYGLTRFACKDGELEGNHFATIVEGQELLPELGRLGVWEGAQDVLFEIEA
jgi:hypothetical protein